MQGPPVEIKSADYWFKVVGMLQQNWALVDQAPDNDACTVFFLHDASGVFDRLRFPSLEDASRALRRNGFVRLAEDWRHRVSSCLPARHSLKRNIQMGKFTRQGGSGGERNE